MTDRAKRRLAEQEMALLETIYAMDWPSPPRSLFLVRLVALRVRGIDDSPTGSLGGPSR